MSWDSTVHITRTSFLKPGTNSGQTRGQRFFFGRACFTFEETTGHFAGSVILFLVVNGQREKVLTGLLLARERHVGHDGRLAQRGDDRTVGLTGDFARFECERLFAPLHGFLHFIKHLSSFILGQSRRSGWPVDWRPHAADPCPLHNAGVFCVTSQMPGPYSKTGCNESGLSWGVIASRS